MDLIFWRHAEADDWTEGCDDMQRSLTSRGEKQAKRMAGWLDRQLPEGTRIMSSPARRCEQTVLALGRKYKLREELSPGTTGDEVLAAAGWPNGKSVVLIVGHQPSLGQSIAQLIGLSAESCPVRKGSVWWLRARERDGDVQTIVVGVQSPELL
ncbi:MULTISPECIES: histidine phosphatase family protein [unclassified Variovorax]|uniref:SixA phosphatase family protein n=1 Tax=unclassified Variovorax TaxID=663243 RepID=UPI001BD64347|nr:MULTISPECIES: histidine phosphatase family protein [unclassified Variovorax]